MKRIDGGELIKDLNEAMVLVVDGAVVAEGIAHAVQAEEVALALIGIHMNLARNEVISSQQRFQPWRPKILTPHSHKRTHLHFINTHHSNTPKSNPKLCQIKKGIQLSSKGSLFYLPPKEGSFLDKTHINCLCVCVCVCVCVLCS